MYRTFWCFYILPLWDRVYMTYRNCWQVFLSSEGHSRGIIQNRNAFLFPWVEKAEEIFRTRKKCILMSLKLDYDIKQMKKIFSLLLLFGSLSHFVFILFTAVKCFSPIYYFLLNFLLDFFTFSTFCFAAWGCGLKVVAKNLALILLDV